MPPLSPSSSPPLRRPRLASFIKQPMVPSTRASTRMENLWVGVSSLGSTGSGTRVSGSTENPTERGSSHGGTGKGMREPPWTVCRLARGSSIGRRESSPHGISPSLSVDGREAGTHAQAHRHLTHRVLYSDATGREDAELNPKPQTPNSKLQTPN